MRHLLLRSDMQGAVELVALNIWWLLGHVGISPFVF